MKLKEVIKRLGELENVEARAGWFESARYDDGTPVAKVALWQEYGVPERSIPPRPFLRPTIAEKKEEWTKDAAQVIKGVLSGQINAEQGMTVIAQKAAADIRQTISRVDSPPLSPITLLLRQWRKEGKEITGRTVGEAARAVHRGERAEGVSTQPLNDTGYMIATLTGLAVKK
ncbi:hypothetical protein [Oxalobacter paraformigenes]|uniref:Uncharacterized protein n=1 Tax=Oxalobacter paraformigenes TaxID=556268 RepID=C3X1U0_9BURK|nr:hypothetical protein [Oxalobacter paraformigenes]EEO27176.1 hypothetical protein OFAG_00329 [Oxalobacter paraformigenes]